MGQSDSAEESQGKTRCLLLFECLLRRYPELPAEVRRLCVIYLYATQLDCCGIPRFGVAALSDAGRLIASGNWRFALPPDLERHWDSFQSQCMEDKIVCLSDIHEHYPSSDTLWVMSSEYVHPGRQELAYIRMNGEPIIVHHYGLPYHSGWGSHLRPGDIVGFSVMTHPLFGNKWDAVRSDICTSWLAHFDLASRQVSLGSKTDYFIAMVERRGRRFVEECMNDAV